MDADVVVIGAGVAGLQCARTLALHGRTVIVLEAADAAGGRVRTDRVDGFLCDHGFQLLNPSYPAARRFLDLDALALQPFATGVLVRAADRLRVVADPLRAPGLAWAAVRSGLLRPAELLALARWLAPVMLDAQRSARLPDAPLEQSLDTAGITGPLRRVMDRFLAGVLAESRGTSSANFTRLLLRSFALGTPSLPEGGMQSIPEQLARHVPDVRLHHRARAVQPPDEHADGSAVTVEVTDTVPLTARHVVVATDATTSQTLTDVPAPPMKGLVTWWWTAPAAPDDRPLLVVDGRDGPDGGPPGPVWNAAVVSAAAPSYAPPGRVLIQATTLLDRSDGDCAEADVRRHLGDIYQCDTAAWSVVTRHRIPRALPASGVPLVLRKPVSVRPGVWVCGDHRDTGSIQGALVSGQRTAHEILADAR